MPTPLLPSRTLAFLLLALPAGAAPQQAQKLLTADPDTRDEFGISATVWGRYLALGALSLIHI